MCVKSYVVCHPFEHDKPNTKTAKRIFYKLLTAGLMSLMCCMGADTELG